MASIGALPLAEISKRLDSIAKSLNSPFTLRKEQKQIIHNVVVQKKNTLAVFHTGFGKSECFGYVIPLLNELLPDKDSIVLVICPLKAIIQDQVRRWERLGIKTAAIRPEEDMSKQMLKDIVDGKMQLIFASPEMIIKDRWRRWLKTYAQRVHLCVMDEVHCMTTWGKSFRRSYMKMGELRAYMEAPFLMLTATCTKPMVDEIQKSLHFSNDKFEVIAELPDRPNIFLEYHKNQINFMESLKWYLEELRAHGRRASRAIIYVNDIQSVSDIYAWFTLELGVQAYAEQPPTVYSRLVEAYHRTTDTESKDRVMERISDGDSSLRCLVATVAFGMGVHIPNIDFVIHWGPPRDVLSYWQEVGRGARDGRNGRAIMYRYPRSVTKTITSELMRNVLGNIENGMCIRKEVLQHLLLTEQQEKELETCNQNARCCQACHPDMVQ